MKINAVKEVLPSLLARRSPVILWGSPGLGKTDVITAAARTAGMDVLVSFPVIADPTDFKGLPGIGGNGLAEFFPTADLRRVLAADKPLVWFFDDLGQAVPAVQAAVMQCLLARQVAGQRIPDCVAMVAATNGKGDKSGVNSLLEPLKGRATLIEVETDVPAWREWARNAGVAAQMVAFIGWRPALLSAFRPTADMSNSPTPRNVVRAAGHIAALGEDHPALEELVTGDCGASFASELLTFLSIWRSLPTRDAILADPMHAPLPSEAGAQQVVLGLLENMAESADVTAHREAIILYADRLPTEYSAALFASVKSSDRLKKLLNCGAAKNWALKHAAVTL